MIPRYAKAARRGLSRVRLYRPKSHFAMRLAHQELKAALTARIRGNLERLHVLPQSR